MWELTERLSKNKAVSDIYDLQDLPGHAHHIYWTSPNIWKMNMRDARYLERNFHLCRRNSHCCLSWGNAYRSLENIGILLPNKLSENQIKIKSRQNITVLISSRKEICTQKTKHSKIVLLPNILDLLWIGTIHGTIFLLSKNGAHNRSLLAFCILVAEYAAQVWDTQDM